MVWTLLQHSLAHTFVVREFWWAAAGGGAGSQPSFLSVMLCSISHAHMHTHTLDLTTGKSDIYAYLNATLKQRIMVIDGAMGTMIQVHTNTHTTDAELQLL